MKIQMDPIPCKHEQFWIRSRVNAPQKSGSDSSLSYKSTSNYMTHKRCTIYKITLPVTLLTKYSHTLPKRYRKKRKPVSTLRPFNVKLKQQVSKMQRKRKPNNTLNHCTKKYINSPYRLQQLSFAGIMLFKTLCCT